MWPKILAKRKLVSTEFHLQVRDEISGTWKTRESIYNKYVTKIKKIDKSFLWWKWTKRYACLEKENWKDEETLRIEAVAKAKEIFDAEKRDTRIEKEKCYHLIPGGLYDSRDIGIEYEEIVIWKNGEWVD